MGQALSRLLKPIQVSHSSSARASLPHRPESDASGKKKKEKNPQEPAEGFKKFAAPPIELVTATPPIELVTATPPPNTAAPKEGIMPGLTLAFLHLLRQLQEKRKSLSLGFGLRDYQNSNSSKRNSKPRKGMVINEKAE